MGLFPLIGGDSRIAARIAELLPRGERFVEAFGGAGSVTLHLAKASAYAELTWNDLDRLYYDSFRLIKYHPRAAAIIREILVRLSRCVDPEARAAAKTLLKEVRLKLLEGEVGWPWNAVWTIVLHYACHIPWRSGLMLRWTYCPTRYSRVDRKLLRCHRLLQSVELRNEDALDLLQELAGEGTVAYVDPPHLISDRWRMGYYRLEFTAEMAEELDEVLRGLRAKILVKLSRGDEEHYRLTGSWIGVRLPYPRDSGGGRSGEYRLYANYRLPSLQEIVHEP